MLFLIQKYSDIQRICLQIVLFAGVFKLEGDSLLSVDKKYKQGNNVVFQISHHFYYIKIRIKIDINTEVNFNIENQTINNISINIFTSIQYLHIKVKSQQGRDWVSDWPRPVCTHYDQ